MGTGNTEPNGSDGKKDPRVWVDAVRTGKPQVSVRLTAEAFNALVQYSATAGNLVEEGGRQYLRKGVIGEFVGAALLPAFEHIVGYKGSVLAENERPTGDKVARKVTAVVDDITSKIQAMAGLDDATREALMSMLAAQKQSAA